MSHPVDSELDMQPEHQRAYRIEYPSGFAPVNSRSRSAIDMAIPLTPGEYGALGK